MQLIFTAAQWGQCKYSSNSLLEISRSARFDAVSTKLALKLFNRKSNPNAITTPMSGNKIQMPHLE